MKRVNFGSGLVTPYNWTNVDKFDYGRPNVVVADARDGLPFADGTFDYGAAHHALQMFGYEELPIVLHELRRVLRPGGVLRISVPDAAWAFERWQSGNSADLPIADDVEATEDGKLCRYLMWHGDAHSLFTFDALRDLLRRNGFPSVARAWHGWSPVWAASTITELDSRPAESLYVEAVK